MHDYLWVSSFGDVATRNWGSPIPSCTSLLYPTLVHQLAPGAKPDCWLCQLRPKWRSRKLAKGPACPRYMLDKLKESSNVAWCLHNNYILSILLTNLNDVKATYPVGSKNVTAKGLLNHYPSNHGNIWLRFNCSSLEIGPIDCSQNIQMQRFRGNRGSVGSWRSQGTQDIDPSWHKLIQHWVNWSKRVGSKGSTDTFKTYRKGMIPNQWLTSSPKFWDYPLYMVENNYPTHNTVKINGNPGEMDPGPLSPDHHPLLEAVHLVKWWPDAIAVIWLPRCWIHCRSSSLNPWHGSAVLGDGYLKYGIHEPSLANECAARRSVSMCELLLTGVLTITSAIKRNTCYTSLIYGHVRVLCSRTRIKHTHVELPYQFHDVPLCYHAGWPGFRMFQAGFVQIIYVPVPS